MMEQSETDLARLVDEASIRNVIARFADAALCADYDAFRALFTSDAVVEVGPPANARATGPEGITDWMRGLRDPKTFFVQFAQPGPIDFDADEAQVRTLISETAMGDGGVYYRNYAVFFDRLRKVNGLWLFARRRNEYLWLDTSPFSGQAFKLPPISVSRQA